MKHLQLLLTTALLATAAAAADPVVRPVATIGGPGDGPGRFRHLEDLVFDSAGRLWTTDAVTGRVQIFDPATGAMLERFGGRGDAAGSLLKPEGIAVAPNGDVYVADSDTGIVGRWNADRRRIGSFAEYGSGPGQNIRSELMSIGGDRLYMADAGNHRVDVFALDGRFLFAFGGVGRDGGRFRTPEAVKVDPSGRVWVTDAGNDRLQVFDRDGRFLRVWGRSGHAAGELSRPMSVAFDARGRLWVTEAGNDRVQVFDDEGRPLTVFGREGSAPGEFRDPHGIAVEPATGRIHVADTGNQRIQVFDPRLLPWPGEAAGAAGNGAAP